MVGCGGRTNGRLWGMAVLGAGMLLAGCVTVPPQPVARAACRPLFRHVDRVVADAGVRDDGPYAVAGFPYLRINRFYASFRHQLGDDGQRFSAWVRQLAALDARARRFELQDLPPAYAARLGAGIGPRLERCRQRLLKTDLATPGARARLRRRARVPDGYLGWERVVGLYPLTALFVSAGVRRWHAEVHRTYALPLATLPVRGRLQRWAPPTGHTLDRAQVRTLLGQVDALGIPRPSPAGLDRLFATFAPVWEVDVADADDRIGTPAWRHGHLVVDTGRPAVFRKLSYTRFNGQVLLQLNYIVWFPARDSHDIYGGRFDGIDWRVTLGPDGEPWLYDAMHNCGCYHEFFPSWHLRLKPWARGPYAEPPLVSEAAPIGEPVVLRIAHQTHYIQRIYRGRAGTPATPMAWRRYDALCALPDGARHRSMFGAHGIVPGSERPERFLLWPTGVRSPGAMRQWGHHDTAFVGHRHFDDPDLIPSLFARAHP